MVELQGSGKKWRKSLPPDPTVRFAWLVLATHTRVISQLRLGSKVKGDKKGQRNSHERLRWIRYGRGTPHRQCNLPIAYKVGSIKIARNASSRNQNVG